MASEPVTTPHPWYGPCDALGPGGRCAECMKDDQGNPQTTEAASALRELLAAQRQYDYVRSLYMTPYLTLRQTAERLNAARKAAEEIANAK